MNKVKKMPPPQQQRKFTNIKQGSEYGYGEAK
jgi:hypothetical protein